MCKWFHLFATMTCSKLWLWKCFGIICFSAVLDSANPLSFGAARIGPTRPPAARKGEGAVGRSVWCYSTSLCFFVSCMAPTNGLLARIINEAAERWKNSVSSSFPLLNSPRVSCRFTKCCKARDQSWPWDLRALKFLPKAEEIVRVTPGGLSIKSSLVVARVFPNF